LEDVDVARGFQNYLAVTKMVAIPSTITMTEGPKLIST